MSSPYRFKLAGTIPPDPDPGAIITYEKFLSFFDSGYESRFAQTTGNVQAANGQIVTRIPDIIGTRHMNYVGTDVPTLSQSLPKLFTTDGKWYTYLPNETDVQYQSETFQAAYPCEIIFEYLMPNYYIFEAYFNNINTFYLGDNGPDFTRATNNLGNVINYGFKPNKYTVIGRTITDDVNADDKVSLKFYADGLEYFGQNPVIKTFRRANVANGFGADTNNAMWGMVRIYFRYGSILTDVQRAQAHAFLMQNNGTEVKAARANNIQITDLGSGGLTASYTYYSPLGLPQDDNKTVIKWVKEGNQGVTNATYIPGASSLHLDKSAYGDNRFIRIEITVGDTSGNLMYIPQSKSIAL
jgi:hypothetical protein